MEYLYQGISVRAGEEAIEASRTEIREGLLVEEAGIHDAVRREVVDDLIHERDLPRGVSAAFKEPAERFLGRFPIQPD